MMHARIIDATGGSHGLRDPGLLHSLVSRPKTSFGSKEMYNTVFKKSAVYLESPIKYHVFVDGNKRISIVAASRFLYMNGYRLSAKEGEIEKLVLRIIKEKLDIDNIANWLEENSISIKAT